MERNTPELWDEVWAQSDGAPDAGRVLSAEARGVRWRRIGREVRRRMGDPAGLRVVEIGAGTGVGAALLALAGAQATVLDYSHGALERSRRFFGDASLPATFVRADALDLPGELTGAFDVSLSFGLAEHFAGESRRRIIAAHLDLLRPGGLAVVSVPNRHNLPYRFFKFAAERTGRWRVGEEYPFSRRELERLCRELGVEEWGFVGDSLLESVRFLIPTRVKLWWARVRSGLRLPEPGPLPGTFLDEYVSYSLVLLAVKPQTPRSQPPAAW